MAVLKMKIFGTVFDINQQNEKELYFYYLFVLVVCILFQSGTV